MGILDLKIEIATDSKWRSRNQRFQRLKSRTDTQSNQSSVPCSSALLCTSSPSTDLTLGTSWSTSLTNVCTSSPSTDLTLGTSWSTSLTNGLTDPLPNPEKKKSPLLPLKLYRAATQSDVDHFIEVLEGTSEEMGLPVAEIVELVSPLGNTLVHVAAREGNNGIVILLAYHYPSLLVKQNLVGDTALHVAVKADDFNVTKSLLRLREDYLEPKASAEDIAKARAMPDDKQLLRIRNNKGNTAMHERLILGASTWHMSWFFTADPKIVCFLNNQGKSPLYLAAEAEARLDLSSILHQRKQLGSNEELLKGKSPLLPAIIARNKEILEKIISSEPAFINLQDEEGKTPLHVAASLGHTDIVQYLLLKDVECSLKWDNNGFFPIHIAAAQGHLEVVKELLQLFQDPREMVTGNRNNILHVAAAKGKIKVVDFILKTPKLSSLINDVDYDGNTPFHLASMNGQYAIVKALKSDIRLNSEAINNEGYTAVEAAEYCMEKPDSDSKLSSTKPECDPSLNATTTTCPQPDDPSSGAATTKCAQPIVSSTSSSANTSLSNDQILGPSILSPENAESKKRALLPLKLYQAAATSDVQKFLKALKESSAEIKLATSEILKLVTPSGNTLLHVAARKGQKDFVELLSSQSPSLLMKQNLIGDTVLHVFAKANHGDAIITLVRFREAMAMPENKELLRVRNNKGNTALHERLMISNRTGDFSLFFNSNPEICYFLNNEGKSPLYLAAEARDQLHVILILHLHGTLGNKEEMLKGKSPLIPVITAGNKDILEKIISNEMAFVNLSDEEGKTPLHYAASLGNIDIIQYLLAQDVESSLKRDDDGFFPIHIAAAQGHIEAVKELLRHCPDPTEMLTQNGQNILHIAAATGKNKVVNFILNTPQCGSLINEPDYHGNTPLHLASMNWHPKIVSTLTWDKRVNYRVINNEGFTSLDAAEYYMDKPVSFDKRLTWTVLKAANAPRAPKQNSFKLPQINSTQSPTSNKSETDNYKERVNTLLLVATLVATVTFAAGFTMPGGNNNSGLDEGLATMLQKWAFYVFVFSDAIAMYSSILVAVSLIWAQLGDLKLVFAALRLAIPLLGTSLAMMSLSFMAGVYLAVSTLNWLAYSLIIMGSAFLCAHLVIFFPLCFPVTSGNYILRYISYYPLQLLISLTSADNKAK